ncbi:MAG TPA: hypothetical protein VHZ24_02725 [Pirellulales bacterium]|jgi:hypothetical protein|nr:hypothetical protein [Pirellulales bacterium]
MRLTGLTEAAVLIVLAGGCTQAPDRATTSTPTTGGDVHTTLRPPLDTPPPATPPAQPGVNVHIGQNANPDKPMVNVQPGRGVEVNVP